MLIAGFHKPFLLKIQIARFTYNIPCFHMYLNTKSFLYYNKYTGLFKF